MLLRKAGLLGLVVLLAGCTALPRPRDAMQPVSSPANWARTEPAAPAEATALQPELRWHRQVSGVPHRLWWGGDTLLVASMSPTPSPWEDQFLLAVDEAGETRWERDLRPARAIDAAVDDQGGVSLSIADGGVKGRLISLDPSGLERWALPWQDAWPRSLAAGGGGRCLVVGYDGQSGAFPGALQALGPDGAPLFAEVRDRLVGFAGMPSADCSTILLGYEGGGTGLYQSDLYRGTGVHLLDREGRTLWSLYNYHRPLALSADGSTAAVVGVPSPDRAYQPPPQDKEPAPPYGQILWLGRQGEILARYRLPFAATVDGFQMTAGADQAVLALTTHRYAGQPTPEGIRRVVWLSRAAGGMEVAWERDVAGRLVALHMAGNGGSLLLAEQMRDGAAWLTLFDRSGKVVWRYRHSAPIVAARLSPTGEQAAVLAEDGLWLFATHRR
jgi:hypothetical protein